jgi:hypothetical protein
MEVVLQPGDFFYHPAGIWHAVETVGEEDSVSINISLDGLTFADHIAGALRQALMADGRFTAMVRTGAPPEESVSQMASLLREAAQRLERLAATPTALIPPCSLWGQPMPPLVPANREGEEEEDEEEGEEEEDEEEEEEAGDLGKVFLHPISPTAVLYRNPLSTLFALDDTDPNDDDEQEKDEEDTAAPRTKAFMVHFAYGAGGDLVSMLRKKVNLDARLGRFVAQQPLAQPFSPGQAPGGSGSKPEGLRALGALVHLGVVLVAEDGGEGPARKKGRQ